MADYTREQFAAAVLDGLGIPQSRGALQALIGWEQAEGGHWHNTAKYNPLNTTLNLPGSGDTGSQGNISVFRDWNQGVDATVQTLRNGHYGGIIDALKAGNARQVASAIDSSPWGTHGDLVYRTITGARAPSSVRVPGSSGSTPSAGGTAGAASPVQPLLDPGVSGNFTGLLGALMSQPQQQAPTSSLGPLQPAAGVALPEGFRPLAPTQQAAPQQNGGAEQALGLLDALRGSDPANGTSEGSGGSEAPEMPSILENVTAQRNAGINASEYRRRADVINAAKLPYQWGGGHGGKIDVDKNLAPLDCSGAVSAVLGIDPRVSGQFTSWGKAGDGGAEGVTVAANDHHVLMKIDGHWFGTSKTNPGGGAGWIPQQAISAEYLKGFTLRHL